MSKRKSRLYFVLFIMLCIALALGCVEALLRFNIIKYTFTDDRGLTLYFDRELIFRFLPHCREDFNNVGYRDRDFSLEKPAGKRRVLFYGDSFIMGLHVETDQTIPRTLEKTAGGALEVYNMGVYSYGPDQSLVQFRTEGVSYKPDIVVLNIYPSNDFNDLIENRIFTLDRRGNLVKTRENALSELLSPVEVVNLASYIGIRTRIFMSPPMARAFWVMFGESNNDDSFVLSPDSDLTNYKYWLMRMILRELGEEARRSNTRLLVSILPSIWNAQEPETLLKKGWPEEKIFTNESIVEEICRNEGIEFINFVDVFRQGEPHESLLYDPEDRHLSVYGHGVVAEALWQKLK